VFLAGVLTDLQVHQWNIGCATILGVRNGAKMDSSESFEVIITMKSNPSSSAPGAKVANEGNVFSFAKWNDWGNFNNRLKKVVLPKFPFVNSRICKMWSLRSQMCYFALIVVFYVSFYAFFYVCTFYSLPIPWGAHLAATAKTSMNKSLS